LLAEVGSRSGSVTGSLACIELVCDFAFFSLRSIPIISVLVFSLSLSYNPFFFPIIFSRSRFLFFTFPLFPFSLVLLFSPFLVFSCLFSFFPISYPNGSCNEGDDATEID